MRSWSWALLVGATGLAVAGACSNGETGGGGGATTTTTTTSTTTTVTTSSSSSSTTTTTTAPTCDNADVAAALGVTEACNTCAQADCCSQAQAYLAALDDPALFLSFFMCTFTACPAECTIQPCGWNYAFLDCGGCGECITAHCCPQYEACVADGPCQGCINDPTSNLAWCCAQPLFVEVRDCWATQCQGCLCNLPSMECGTGGTGGSGGAGGTGGAGGSGGSGG